MDLATAFLTASPAGLAMFAEWSNPVNEAVLRQQAKLAIMERSLVTPARPADPADSQQVKRENNRVANDQKSLEDLVVVVSGGALSVAGLIPTGLSVLTTAVAVANEFENKFWAMDILLLLAACCVIWILRLLSGRTFLQIASEPMKQTSTLTGAEWFSKMILWVNGLLIALIVSVAGVPYLATLDFMTILRRVGLHFSQA
jgi:hypothetical protein